ncbi:MAG: 30S ribosomal protein S4 [Candidatus Omnitrophica bacterium CG11_big_fil_rev_8_21_14_0_20_45_26]|uniref:Small ribosomal subunit protein uS4 n=1 Tax=Candidatus Abzuiibacterium crystallinum TaxID=1974748 RepID=A0A2H0LQB9_9BACT|nr:MAG: 30S ribosomal protein S4 [Candidatus Omnitrophica bacterium CG11_big_fil_rev_8_21_14_0_20_45_26]PIW65084.1 MAG: 30S ribosomal protein S4 [Candidatus Omnitrophica bacterium CG12_big_fil_rev_8_21_14_0_65_45_16]
MGRYTGPVIRLHRREGTNLGLKGRRATDEKYDERLTQPPGMHGRGHQKLSNYGLQLREKQKLKRIYGMMENQFRVFFRRAAKKKGVTGETLIQLLESRLDNVVYRLLFSTTRREARQMVNHGLITVNGKPVDIPSYSIQVGDVIGVRQKEKTIKRVEASLEKWQDLQVPEWLELDRKKLVGKVLREPTKADAQLPVEESQIVELFSK